MANAHHITGLIRGHEGTMVMVDHEEFDRTTPYITVEPAATRRFRRGEGGPTIEAIGGADYAGKFGVDPIQIPVDNTKDIMTAHIENFLSCMRSREKPHLDVETGAKAQTVINLAVQSYREGKAKYRDDKNWKARH